MGKIKQISVGLALFFAMTTLAAAAQGLGGHAGSAQASTALGQSGEKSKNQTRNDGVPTPQERTPRYRVEPGDVLDLNFAFTPEMNQTVTIQPDGFIAARGLGDLYAQGKTTAELAEALRGAYGKFLHDPVITVDLKDFQKPYFIVGGEVGHSGKYDLRADTTVTEAVAIAGGFTEKAKHSQVLLFRRVSGNTVEVKNLNVKKMLKSANLQEDAYLRPGDMLYVPKNLISKIQRFLPTDALSLYFKPL